MKKIILTLLLLILLTKNVFASEENNINKVLYKWYKEEKIDSLFYPKKETLTDYQEEKNNIQYGEYSEWDNKYCSYSKEYYLVEEKNITKYDELLKTKYIMLESLYNIGISDDFNIIKIYYNKNELSYKIIDYSTYRIKIELEKEYDTDKLEFYIETSAVRYFIYLFNDINFKKQIISYSVIPRHDGKRLVWTKEWISEKSNYESKVSEDTVSESKSIKNISSEFICRVREINTYRFKTERKYYDDKYHIFIDGYIPDVESRLIYYEENKDTQKQIIEINKNESNENIIKEENAIEENHEILKCDSSNNKTIIKKKIIKKVPLKIYIVIIALIFVIVIQMIKNKVNKSRLNNLS